MKAGIKSQEEGRAEVGRSSSGWNWDGDLDPNPIKTPLDDGELNPYLKVKAVKSQKYLGLTQKQRDYVITQERRRNR